MKITLEQIDKFIRDNGISQSEFSRLAKISASWITTERLRHKPPNTPISCHNRIYKGISSVLNGEVQVPPNKRRTPSKKPSSVPFDYDVFHLIKKVHDAGPRRITFEKFQELCQADWKYRQAAENLGLSHS